MDRDLHEISIKNELEWEQLFKISRFKEVIKRTKPHKHDAYFELIYLSQGAGFHWIDFQRTSTRLGEGLMQQKASLSARPLGLFSCRGGGK